MVPCDEGDVCTNGQCAKTCQNECNPEGSRQCSGNGTQTCGDFDGDECLEWGPEMPCDEGQACSGGNCRAACVNECAEGSSQCAGNGVQSCGNFDDDDCLEWGEAVPCEMGENCSGGECAEECVNECGAHNQRQCSGNGFQTCGDHDEDPCLEWGVVNACRGGLTCSGGECRERCVNECADGSSQCAGRGTQACGNFDEDPCLEWSAVAPCDDGENCSNGACAAACGDECGLGSSRCAPGGVQTCGDFDDDDCADWGPAAQCPEGEVCSNGECAERCVDECARGARRCEANGFQQCGQFDADECTEWSAARACEGGEVCSNGQCSRVCANECGEGATQCAGGGVQRCGEFDEDNCLEWSEQVACPDGESCSNGACAPFCNDECVEGSNRCGGGGVQSCGNFDDDGCTEWGNGVACPDGESCSLGRCAAVCDDECEANGTRCNANGVQSCGEFDGDACREWSPGVACEAGDVCSDGACVPFEGDCDGDDDCPDGFACQFGRCALERACREDGDCAVGEVCDVINQICRAPAPVGIGNRCGDAGDCDDGLECLDPIFGGYCTTSCGEDAPCPVGSSCYQTDADDPSVAWCLRDCAERDDCVEDNACFPVGGGVGGACLFKECEAHAGCSPDPLLAERCVEGRCIPSDP